MGFRVNELLSSPNSERPEHYEYGAYDRFAAIPPGLDQIGDDEPRDSEIFDALFGISQSIAGSADLPALCDSMASSLRRVVAFDSLALTLRDSVRNEFRLLGLSSCRPERPKRIALPADDDHVVAMVWCSQEPLVLSPLDFQTPGQDVFREAAAFGIRSLTLVPLSHGDQRLGILGFGFTRPYRPTHRILAFLQRVACEMAVAVDACAVKKTLARERQRIKALFEVTAALSSKPSVNEWFSTITIDLRNVVEHDFTAIILLDQATGKIRRVAEHPSGDPLPDVDDSLVSPDDMPAGVVMAAGKPVVTGSADFHRFSSSLYRRYCERGVQSSCCVPLWDGDNVVGVLDLGRMGRDPFTEEDMNLLVHVGRQIGLAIRSSPASCEASVAKGSVATEMLNIEEALQVDQSGNVMIGKSPAFKEVLERIQLVAPTDATVVIQGETGTGKELVARAIHGLSGRNQQSFVTVNCAAIPATLLESELFGHEKGAFTGAIMQKIGRFELAHKGTLFLDEIGEIPLELQSKLWRVLQEQEFERLGGTRTISVDVRIIAATNRDLEQMVDEGRFRSDLYYRLQVFPLLVPPLRQRREDIPLLVLHFAQRFAKKIKRAITEIPADAITAVTSYAWPGNIRELQNVIERSVILSPGRVLQLVFPEVVDVTAKPSNGQQLSAGIERDRIIQGLRESGGTVAGPTGAAARLGMRRTTLQSRMKKLNIERQYR